MISKVVPHKIVARMGQQRAFDPVQDLGGVHIKKALIVVKRPESGLWLFFP